MATDTSRHDSGPAIVVGTTASARASIGHLVEGAVATPEPGADQANGVNVSTPDPARERALVAAFQGQQRTGGYRIRITAIERAGDRLVVRAAFTVPATGATTTQALTSPVHVVSIAPGDAAGLREAVLLDETGAERARGNMS